MEATETPSLRRAGNLAVQSSAHHPLDHPLGTHSAGRPLPHALRRQFESQADTDLVDVRVHTGERADAAARSIGALAFARGGDIAFRAGEYDPESPRGRKVIAHELAHVVQQQGRAGDTLHRQPDPQAREGGGATAYRRIHMRFDGSELIVYGDGREILRYSASSGRPIQISPEHARDCGGDERVDTYMSPRFTGIRNLGPIPEGEFRFSPPQIREFSTGEQLELLVGGIMGDDRVTVGGTSMHAGDWGGGRVALQPVRVVTAACGNPGARSEFFLHGGLLAGSSGCIDIGSSFGTLAKFLRGYRRDISIEVAYETATPRVGFLTGFGGAVAYQGFAFRHGPTLRLGAELGAGSPRFVASAEYQAVLDWAGGALAAGVHLDVPMNSEDAFVRAGLRGAAEFRILHALYGELSIGGFVESAHAGSPAGGGLELGAGLKYDFGAAQLGFLYNHLQSAAAQDRNQVLLGLGFRW